jgi:hypothetical protein
LGKTLHPSQPSQYSGRKYRTLTSYLEGIVPGISLHDITRPSAFIGGNLLPATPALALRERIHTVDPISNGRVDWKQTPSPQWLKVQLVVPTGILK